MTGIVVACSTAVIVIVDGADFTHGNSWRRRWTCRWILEGQQNFLISDVGVGKFGWGAKNIVEHVEYFGRIAQFIFIAWNFRCLRCRRCSVCRRRLSLMCRWNFRSSALWPMSHDLLVRLRIGECTDRLFRHRQNNFVSRFTFRRDGRWFWTFVWLLGAFIQLTLEREVLECVNYRANMCIDVGNPQITWTASE